MEHTWILLICSSASFLLPSQASSGQEGTPLDYSSKTLRQRGLGLVLHKGFSSQKHCWVPFWDRISLITTAVLYNSSKVVLAQTYKITYTACAERLCYTCTVNMGQSYLGVVGCTLTTLWQAGGKEDIRIIWLALDQRISRTSWKAMWWKANSHRPHLCSSYSSLESVCIGKMSTIYLSKCNYSAI